MSTEFSDLKVSTTTVTASFPCPVNIIDVAKYLPLDDVIIGIKLVYAGGNSSIIRGVAKMSKKAKDFYNQVTFTIRLPTSETSETTDWEQSSIIVSCKIFHNGTLHVTGTHTLDEATEASNVLLGRLKNFSCHKMVSVRTDVPFLAAYDNLLYSSTGKNIGWIDKDYYKISDDTVEDAKDTKGTKGTKGAAKGNSPIYIKNEYVILDEIHEDGIGIPHPFHVFMSSKWSENRRKIYTLDGEEIGMKRLEFKLNVPRRHYEVKFGHIYSGNKIVGNEITDWNQDYLEKLQTCKRYTDYLKNTGYLLHCGSAFSKDEREKVPTEFCNADFYTHMINMFFKAPFNICRKRLHKTFLEEGYYSRFDPCSHAAVNLRFHYHNMTMNQPQNRGKCVKMFKKPCDCKDISVSCFNSGKMNITGLATLEQGTIVYEFLKDFFIKHRAAIYAPEH